MLAVPKFFFSATAAGLVYFNFAYFEPVAAQFLQRSLDLSEVWIGVYFSVFPVFYTVSCLF